jgi:1,4-alpha-glucan branching enzyme
MSLTKKFLKSKSICKVTFRLQAEAVETAGKVVLVGDFNEWDTEAGIAMQQLKNGDFKTTIDLETGKAYQFRYLIDGKRWENDWAADQYIPTSFGTDNSVVDVTLN